MSSKNTYRLLTVLSASLVSLTACESLPPASQNPSSTTAIQSPSQGKVIIRDNKTAPVQSNTHANTPVSPSQSERPSSATPAPTYPSHGQYPSVDPSDRNNPLMGSPSEPYEGTSQNPITTEPSAEVTAPSNGLNKPQPSFPEPIVTIPPEPQPSAREALLERARQNSRSRPSNSASSGENLPAFQRLMQSGIAALQANRLTDAESSFTRAQRLAPRSSAVYYYLSQVALKKNQPRKAEAMARRGLVVTQDSNRRRALWKLILRAGQMQNNSTVIAEASQALR